MNKCAYCKQDSGFNHQPGCPNAPATSGTVEPLVRQSSSCWMTDDCETHPWTGCPSSGDWLMVATNGHERWTNCSQCNKTWYQPNTQAEVRVSRTLPRVVGGKMEDKQ